LKLIINIDSLSHDKFNEKKLVSGIYEISSSKKVRIRPSFSFMGEYLSGKPPKDTGLWMDHVFSKKSPYWFLKSNDFQIKKRSSFSRKFLYILSKILSKNTYDPLNIPSGVLKYFAKSKFQYDFGTSKEALLVKKFGVNTASLVSGDIPEVEKSIKAASSDVVFVNYQKLDSIGHIGGPNSKHYLNYTNQIFESIRGVLEGGEFSEVQIMSDHGMYEVKKYIHIFEFLKDYPLGKDWLYFVNSPFLRLWKLKKDAPDIEVALKDLEGQGLGVIMTPKIFSEYGLPRSPEFGDIIFWLKPGNHMVPDYFWADREIKGMHGYFGWDASRKIILKPRRN